MPLVRSHCADADVTWLRREFLVAGGEPGQREPEACGGAVNVVQRSRSAG